MSGYLDGLGHIGRRMFRDALAMKAAQTARDWAENSQDVHDGKFVPVREPAAIEALRGVYEVVLRRGGMDHVERIDQETALAFPSQSGFVRPSTILAYLGHVHVSGDSDLSICDFERQRMQPAAWLASGIDRDGFCRFAVLIRYGDLSPEFHSHGRRDALRQLAFKTLDPATRAAFSRNAKSKGCTS
ncbi:hypothetical protein [Paracoccus sp. KR1-242]|uniref:hypothetical protein n=1 Tax=Paracoccus sp. KR1-242 TaxID=3410028 RepID=UPI003C0F080F